jgi:hypothetical protein
MKAVKYSISIITPDKRDGDNGEKSTHRSHEFFCCSEEDAVEQGRKWVKCLYDTDEYCPENNPVVIQVNRQTMAYFINV